ncbi:uncharacterized protein RHOBADRAFT_55253 [Rhodotorula graminis WP1]|uniref:HAM1-like N-terminal domain-containing protein n=1 Tax=Rhodotorula graminis (strain WP1) TaxID=578459 RepID=A0A0P9GJ59_RHOGW|nr:uncharacterized protein RHOBADRAFT_55253 [Rhodotorula graminis WP1]KPV73010.1 hypothetical protein RHOBADRAFT_55253 [Rhodotorula graminis WP1]
MPPAPLSLSDERTPLLPPPPHVPAPAVAPPPPRRPRSHRRPHQHHEPRPRPPRSEALSIPALARAAAALKAGHLPSTTQLLALADLLLESPFLDDAATGTVWEPTYGEGRLGTGGLSREGERVRLAVRECVESARELVEGRNPVVVERGEGDEECVSVGVTGEGELGDGWQEFWWRYRATKVDVELPEPHLPVPDRSTLQQSTTSLVNLAQLFLTSPALQSLVTDIVLLVRDTADVVFETAQAKDQLGPETVDALERVVEAAAEGAVGASAVKAHDADTGTMSSRPGARKGEERARAAGGRDEALDPPEVAAPLAPGDEPAASAASSRVEGASRDKAAGKVEQKDSQALRDEFVDRVKKIFLQLQAQPQYQRSMQTLLALVRDYVRTAVDKASPRVHVEPAASSSSPSSTSSSPHVAQPAPIDDADPTRLLLPLLEPFTGGPGSLVPLRRAAHALLSYLDPSRQDTSPSRLRDLAHSVDALVEKALLEPGWIGSAAAQRQVGEMHDGLRALARDCPVLAQDVQRVIACVAAALQVLAGDELLARSVRALAELAGAIGAWTIEAAGTAARAAGGEGVAAVWGDVVEWLVPRVLGVLKEIPLPRFEFASPTVSLAIDPPSLLATSIIPSSISLQQSTSITYLPSFGSASAALPVSASHPSDPSLARAPATARTASAASTLVAVEGVQLEIKDVGYYASYHTGIPCVGDVTESGLLDLRFGRPSAPDGSSSSGGLGFALATSTPPPPGARTLFTLQRHSTAVALADFHLTPHSSSHPWLVWLLRPLLRVAVRKAVECELREAVLEPGAKWVGRVGFEVRERAEELRARAVEEAQEGRERDESEMERLWRWVRAAWDVLAGRAVENEEDEVDESGSDASSATSDADGDAHSARHLHLNRHGVAIDLEAANGTAGIGSEGVVLPVGDAPIPLPEGRSPPKGLARAARDEVRHEVEAGQEAAKEAMRAVGEVGEEADRRLGREVDLL